MACLSFNNPNNQPLPGDGRGLNEATQEPHTWNQSLPPMKKEKKNGVTAIHCCWMLPLKHTHTRMHVFSAQTHCLHPYTVAWGWLLGHKRNSVLHAWVIWAWFLHFTLRFMWACDDAKPIVGGLSITVQLERRQVRQGTDRQTQASEQVS